MPDSRPPGPAFFAAYLRCRDDRCPSPGAARRRCGGGGHWMPSPAGSRARRGGWGSSRLCFLPHVCPSSPGHGAHLSGAFTGSPNSTEFVAKEGAGTLHVAHIENYSNKNEFTVQINALMVLIWAILTATVSLWVYELSNRRDGNHMVQSDGWSLLIPTARCVTLTGDHFRVSEGSIFTEQHMRVKICLECRLLPYRSDWTYFPRISQPCFLMLCSFLSPSFSSCYSVSQ